MKASLQTPEKRQLSIWDVPKKRFKKNNWPYFYHEHFLKCPHTKDDFWKNEQYKNFIIIGTKNTGKTTSFLRYAIKRAVAGIPEQQHRFVLVLRQQTKADDYMTTITRGSDWWENCRAKGGFIEYQFAENEWAVIGVVVGLNGGKLGQSKENKGFDFMLFDDFMPVPNEKRIKNFTNALAILYSNYMRKNIKTARLVLTGNNNRYDGELLNELNIDIHEYPGGCWTIENADPEKPRRTVIYMEGVGSKEGIISPQHKDFSDTALANFNDETMNYLTSNQVLTNLHGVIKWKDVGDLEPIYYLVVEQQLYMVSKFDGNCYLVYREYDGNHLIKNYKTYTFNVKNLMAYQHVKISSNAEWLAEKLMKKAQLGKLYFLPTSITARESLLKDIKAFVSKQRLLGKNKQSIY